MFIRELHQKWPKKYELLFFFAVSLPLIQMHHWSHARDAGAYVRGGMQIIEGLNPYSDEVFRGGPFGAVIMALAIGKVPGFWQAMLILILNLAGIWFYVRTFVPAKTLNLFLCLLVIWSSSNRTNLDTIQLTGVILGVVALMVRQTEINPKGIRFVNSVLTSIILAVLLDSKPHIVLPFFILICIWLRNRLLLILTLVTLFVGHFFIGTIFGWVHIKNWLSLVLKIGEDQNFEQFQGAAHNYWQLVTYFGFPTIGWSQVIPFAFYFVMLLLSALNAHKFSLLGVNILAVLCISITSYSHFYDFVPMVAILLIILSRERFNAIESGIIAFIMIPQNWSSWPLLVALFAVLAIHAFLRVQESIESANTIDSIRIKKIVYGVAGGILFYAFIQVLNQMLPLPRELIDALTTSELLSIFISVILVKGKRAMH